VFVDELIAQESRMQFLFAIAALVVAAVVGVFSFHVGQSNPPTADGQIPTTTKTINSEQEQRSQPDSETSSAAPILPETSERLEVGATLKIAQCQASYDSNLLNITRAVDEQIVYALSDSGELNKVNTYPSDITKLQARRQVLLREALLSAPYTDSSGNTLTSEQRLALQRQIAAGLEVEIQQIETEIFEKQAYLRHLNDIVIPELEKTGENELKQEYLYEYSRCLGD